jgi:hypothetical protein
MRPRNKKETRQVLHIKRRWGLQRQLSQHRFSFSHYVKEYEAENCLVA